MRILLVANHYAVAGGRFYARAFRRLGHDVRTFGPAMGNKIWNMEVDPRWTWEPDYDPAKSPVLGDWKPELIITCDSAYTIMGESTAPHICIGIDNHVRDYSLREYDLFFGCHTWGARMTEPSAVWLPPAYDPETHVNLHRERSASVGIMAVGYVERIELVEKFNQAGVMVSAGQGLLWDDYRDFYNGVKVALVKSIKGDLTQRFFECMAMGCCVLADPTIDADKLGFRQYIDYMPYSNHEDAIEKARALLENGRWLEFARNGAHAVAPHTWDARAQFILNTCKENGLLK